MKKFSNFFLLLCLPVMITGLFLQSCKKKEVPVEPQYLVVMLPTLTLRNERYYSLNNNTRSIELEFSEPLDTATIRGQLSFSDKSGSLDADYTWLAMDRKIVIQFIPGFSLKKGWRYQLTIGTGLKSISGNTFSSIQYLEPKPWRRSGETRCHSMHQRHPSW
jgi:hypothetical protein